MILRAAITKGESVRYISHLDFARAVERALRRAQLPVAYSEGFNPHVKLAFASALSVGVTSRQEYFDVELTQAVEPEAFLAKLSAVLPDGMAVLQAVPIEQPHKALMAVVNFAAYTVELPLTGSVDAAEQAVAAFNAAQAVSYTKHSPKGNREIDLKQYIVQPVAAAVIGSTLTLSFGIAITPTGSAKPSEVIEVLSEAFHLPVQRELALIQREGLWVKREDDLISPLNLRG